MQGSAWSKKADAPLAPISCMGLYNCIRLCSRSLFDNNHCRRFVTHTRSKDHQRWYIDVLSAMIYMMKYRIWLSIVTGDEIDIEVIIFSKKSVSRFDLLFWHCLCLENLFILPPLGNSRHVLSRRHFATVPMLDRDTTSRVIRKYVKFYVYKPCNY